MARFEISSVEELEMAAPVQGADSLFELGLMYATGRDVPMDYVLAHKWFNLAAMRGNRNAKDYRIELSREMEREEIREAQRLARNWLSQH